MSQDTVAGQCPVERPLGQEPEREAFESAMAANGYYLKPERYRDGTYRDFGYAAGWAMWNAAVAAERERCAKVCQKVEATLKRDGLREQAFGAGDCATNIRLGTAA